MFPKFFGEVLDLFPKLRSGHHNLTQKILTKRPEWVVGRLGAQKTLRHDRQDFEAEYIEDWPNVTFIINNDPEIQTIAVSRNFRAFTSTGVVVEIIKSNLRPYLHKYQLELHIEAQFEKDNFWAIVNKFPGRITSVKFELVSPNMANISKALKIDLRQINKATNSQKTNIELNSGDTGALEIERNNDIINGLVEYSAAGGGDISFRVRGYRKKIRTSKNVKEVTIDLLETNNLSPRTLEAIKAFLR